jgi:putative radical SAM enzyme (TIGR03279 family)
MPAARVVSVARDSPAQRAGLRVGDELLSIDGQALRDVIGYQLLTDGQDPEVEVRRGGLEVSVRVEKAAGDPLGIGVSSALFDRVRTCDNHCEFCFIHQLPKGMRRSLYVRDDDYRLSFLYGNFTTLTRFTELDLERVLTERLSPLFVSIHSTDPHLRARMLRNARGATSLRWLRALLDGGIEVHGQIVVCPGVNDSQALETTLAGIADEYPELATVACVPLGISRYTTEPELRGHGATEAGAVIDLVEEWQELFMTAIGRRMIYAADEYYLLAGRPFPPSAAYDGFPQHENGIGMARAFAESFFGHVEREFGVRAGFFSWVDGAPAYGYRARRVVALKEGEVDERGRVTTVITGEYGARVLGPLLAGYRERADVALRLLPVHNSFFGGNIAVTGLLTGIDIADALEREPDDHRYLLPDVCLSEGRFLDGSTLADMPRPVEVVGTDGFALRRALESTRQRRR